MVTAKHVPKLLDFGQKLAHAKPKKKAIKESNQRKITKKTMQRTTTPHYVTHSTPRRMMLL